MFKRPHVRIILAAVLLATAGVPAAYAQLQRVGPVDLANGGYPAWYQDKSGLALEFCKPTNQSELNGGWCLILPADVPNGATPEVPFTNYSGEHFYWNATAGSGANGGGVILVLALEGAFGNNVPRAGDQVVFGRLRIKIASVPVTGDYKIYTPFGDFDFPGLSQGDKLFFTSDIGITCGTGFDCALNSQIGPFLTPSAVAGGAEVPPIPDLVKGSGVDPWYDALPGATPYPANGKKYISDPARIGPVTGSPLPPFISAVDGQTYNHNRFRIEVNGALLLDEPNFSTQGRVMANTIPGQVSVRRASYGRTATSTKLDVFATADPTTQGRIPASPVPAAASPDLGFYDAPCATDPVTGVVTGPPVAAPGEQPFLYYQMLKSGTNWWGGSQPPKIPAQVCVQDLNARDAFGNVTPAYFLGDVTDEVDITTRFWDPTNAGGTLTIAATSSDLVVAPMLTVAGFGQIDPATGQFQISDLAGPPARVTVISTRGGVAVVDIRTGVGIPISPTVPVASADRVTTDEDTPAANINVLANDALAGAALPAGATVAITGAPRLGTVTLNADSTLTYMPSANLNGTDIVGYTVTVSGVTSNEGYVTIVITPVNDAPTAVNDSAGVPNNRSVTLGVLANDSDPDGSADLAGAVIESLPAAGATLTCNGGAAVAAGTYCSAGSITISATALGTFSFSYRAQDVAGALSANTATVSVTVNATEAIVVTKSQFVAKQFRWVVTGTDSVIAGQTLSMTYVDGTYKINGSCTGSSAGFLVGTAPVDALGNWSLDAIVTSAGQINPTNTSGNSTGFWCSPPKSVRVTSPLGGTATANIIIK